MKWVRISGVVIAVDEFGPWRAYTVDDSSGATVECLVNLPKPSSGNDRVCSNLAAAQQPPQPKPIDSDISVGDIIDVKGGIKIYRQTRQIMAEKIVRLRSTEQEVQFWEKVTALRKEVLQQPWVLDRKTVRKCRKEAEGYEAREARRARRERQRVEEGRSTGKENKIPPVAEFTGPSRQTKTHDVAASGQPAVVKPPRASGLEKRPKPVKRTLPITGKYSALGL